MSRPARRSSSRLHQWESMASPPLQLIGPEAALAHRPEEFAGWDLDDALPRFLLRDDSDIGSQAEPHWLLEHYIPGQGFAVLVGPSGGWKTFLALDLALSIAAGRAWR